MMRPKAVVFDLDGTLTYTLEDLWLSVNHALREMELPERSLEDVRQFVGNGVGMLVRRSMGNASIVEADFKQCFAIFHDYYVRHCQDHTRLYDGIDELLSQLKTMGVPMAIVSNKLQAGVDELHKRYFAEYIDVAIGEREGVNRKPAPDMVLMALGLLGIDTSEALYVGDSEVDIQTARNAGLKCVSVLWGFRERDFLENEGAIEFVSTPLELLKFFKD